MKDFLHNPMYCICNPGHDLVLSLRCTPECGVSQCFSIPAAQLAIGRIIEVITEFRLMMEAAAALLRKRARRAAACRSRMERRVMRSISFKVRVAAMRL